MSDERFFWVDVGFVCFGVVARSGVVVDAAPIASWMKGKTLADIRPYLIRKRARVVEIHPV